MNKARGIQRTETMEMIYVRGLFLASAGIRRKRLLGIKIFCYPLPWLHTLYYAV